MKLQAAAILMSLVLGGTALAQTDERAAPGGPKANSGGGGGLFQGTAEEQAACNPDATRYCLDDIPDTFRVLACLQKNRTKLRKTCLNVLEAHGQ